jgi:chromosome segregation ATPase
MSPIGRVFIVLNVALAGAFLYFAGVYLQGQTSWRKKENDLQAEFAAYKSTSTAEISKVTSERNDFDRQLRGLDQKLKDTETRLKEKESTLEAKEGQITQLQGNIAKIEGSIATLSTAIESATKDSTAARQSWMEAVAAKDKAVNDKEAADAALGQANVKVADLEKSLADANGKIASLDDAVKQKDVLLGIVNQKYPGVLALAQPQLDGRIEVVSKLNDLVTILVSNNPANAAIKPGYSFAISDAQKYKGEAVVTEVKDNICFAKITRRVEGATINVGDRASTNPAGGQ